ncbi:MAG TPA: hypothetical protein VEJ16_18720 [Alphaproteobacteria bacterium]|nr:hypothetical protein [Alphaproteobacteria bacterium]
MSRGSVVSSLGRFAPPTLSKEDFESLRTKCWIERGLLVFSPEEVQNEFVRQGVVNWASVKFGKRIKREK